MTIVIDANKTAKQSVFFMGISLMQNFRDWSQLIS
jgi:hypothetical protein